MTVGSSYTALSLNWSHLTLNRDIVSSLPLRQMSSLIVFSTLVVDLLIVVGSVQAQTTSVVLGRVIDASTNQPVPFATVYINASTRGTAADAEGNYQLAGVLVGTVEIVASSVGYNAGRQTIRLSGTKPSRVTFSLTPDAKSLQAITVTAKRSRAYDRMTRTFQQELLGNTPFSDKCLITNLDVVSLTQEDGRLEAQASQPLVIDNKALGYRIYYDLTHFDSFRRATHYAGTSRFEALPPENPEQAQRWERNRQKAYRGSIRHLVASLIAGTYEQEGFLVYKATFDVPADPSIPVIQSSRELPTVLARADSLLKPAQLASERQLFSASPLEVFYTRQHVLSTPYRDMPYAYSVMYMPKGKAAIVTTEGWIAQPNGLEVRGAMSEDRLSTLLPADWQPAQPVEKSPTVMPNEGTVLPADTLLRSLVSQWDSRQKGQSPSLFLHIDKSLYATGDRLWFSGLVLDPTTHQPFIKSITEGENPVHVELMAPDGRQIMHQWARVVEGRTSGNFRLSDSLATGLYRLLAYTETDTIYARPAFERTVSIVNGLSVHTGANRASPTVAGDSIDVQFLPEGGHWVAGLAARLGIKAINRQGRGVVITGHVHSIQGTELGHFATNQLGIGSVDLLPQSNQRYMAEVNTSSGHLLIDLPPVDSSGLVLAADVVTDSTQLVIRVQAAGDLASRPVYLVVQSGGKVVQQTKLQLLQGKARLTVPTATLPVGVAQITLLSAQGMPYAERLVFIPERLVPIQHEVITDKTTYQPRTPVTVSLRVTDGYGEPLSIIGSVSVTDAGQLPADTSAATIRTHLLLSGELRGRVEQANEYVKSNQINNRQALDDLLLTQGWRRFTWRFRAPAAKPGAVAPIGISLAGQVLDKKNKVLPNVNVLFTFTGRSGAPFARSARVDQQGRFRIDDLVLLDTVTVGMRVMTAVFKSIPSAHVVLTPPGGYFRSSNFTGVDVAGIVPLLPSIQQRQASNPSQYREWDARQLQEVTVRAAKPDDDSQARRVSLHGAADVTILFDEKSRSYANTYDMLSGGVSGVQVIAKGEGSGYTVTVRGSGSFRAPTPQYIVDGLYVDENTQGNILFMLNPGEIERIEVIKNAGGAIYGARGGAGVIAFFTKRGRSDRARLNNSDETTQPYQGYLTQREFYTPRFDSPPEEPASYDDRRDVLYWKPILLTNGRGTTTFRFPLSTISRTIRITLQGITTDGRPVYVNREMKMW